MDNNPPERSPACRDLAGLRDRLAAMKSPATSAKTMPRP